jgi:hypothetical protein
LLNSNETFKRTRGSAGMMELFAVSSIFGVGGNPSLLASRNRSIGVLFGAERPAFGTNGFCPVLLNIDDLSQFAILLDIDGTLLDIAPTPYEVVVPDGLTETLASLNRRLEGALALVSGRRIEEIDAFFKSHAATPVC